MTMLFACRQSKTRINLNLNELLRMFQNFENPIGRCFIKFKPIHLQARNILLLSSTSLMMVSGPFLNFVGILIFFSEKVKSDISIVIDRQATSMTH